jgi:HD-GYP domain-containing protein (c-di-GMP phosphodiesterase class II)
MSDTRTLLNRIGAFRRRLEQMPPLVANPHADEANRIVSDAEALTTSLRKIAGVKPAESAPPVLTHRARGLLEDARGLIARQRQLSSDTYFNTTNPNDPLGTFHRKTVALTDAALRLVQAFPDAADIQLRLCDGVDAMLAIIRDRLDGMHKALREQKNLVSRIDRQAKLLADLVAGRMVPLTHFAELAETILDEARQALPIRFLTVAPLSSQGLPESEPVPPPSRFVAAHALTCAQIVARLAPHDYEFASNPMAAVLAALVMDVGMLRVPAAVLATNGPLDAGDRRSIDVHPRISAEIVRTYLPEAAILADAIAAHHERPDGTGYPNGLRGDATPSLSKLLAVADHYAAMNCDRPHRPALDPRTAMTDVLLDAEKNRLDRDFAEYLVHLSFHPVGTVVELTDGRIGVVISNHGGRMNLKTTSRPVVALLTDHAGKVLPKPDHIDLSAAERGSVVRTLGTDERRTLLADWYPELCA